MKILSKKDYLNDDFKSFTVGKFYTMISIEKLSDITLDFDTLLKSLHTVNPVRLAVIDFEGEITPDDSQKEYLQTFWQKIGFTNQKEALEVLWKEVRQPYLKRRVQTGRWMSAIDEPDPTEAFYNRFLLKRPAVKTIEEIRTVGNNLRIGHGVVETLYELEVQEIMLGIVSGTLLPFLKEFMGKSPMEILKPIPLYAADVNTENEIIAPLQTKPYLHSQKIALINNLSSAYGLFAKGEVGVVDDGVSGIELFKTQERTYRPIAFNPSDHLLKEISVEDSLSCHVIISDDLRSILPILLGDRVLDYPEVKSACEESKYFEKKPGTVWSDIITGLGNYSPETGRPENLRIDPSMYGYRQEAIAKYRVGMNS